MAAIRLPAWLNSSSVSYPAENDRLSEAASLAPGGATLSARTGVFPATGTSLTVAAQSTPDMSVQVQAGQCAIQGTATTTQGVYICTSDATQTLAIAAANATNPRIDIVCVTVEDAQYAGSNNDAILQVITGVPAATPAAPVTPANSIVLAQISVAANATSIVNGNITDKRTFTVARGGTIPCLSTARPSNPYAGMSIFETDTKLVARYDGTAWTYVSPPAVARTNITSFSNSWTANTNQPAAYRGVDGRVHLEGSIVSGTTTGGTIIATLPVAVPYPAANRAYVCPVTNTGYGSAPGFELLLIDTLGRLIIRGTWPGVAGDAIVLDGVSYLP